MARKPRLVVCIATIAIGYASSAFATCGTRGGPGYRGPDGKCVGWAEIGKKCGSPPSLRCAPELAQPEAPSASERGRDIQRFKDDAHARVK
jgi:hypothetical protein